MKIYIVPTAFLFSFRNTYTTILSNCEALKQSALVNFIKSNKDNALTCIFMDIFSTKSMRVSILCQGSSLSSSQKEFGFCWKLRMLCLPSLLSPLHMRRSLIAVSIHVCGCKQEEIFAEKWSSENEEMCIIMVETILNLLLLVCGILPRV